MGGEVVVVVDDDVGWVGLRDEGVVDVVGDVEIAGGVVVEFVVVVETEDGSEVEVVDLEFVDQDFGSEH